METFDNGFAGYSHWNVTQASSAHAQSQWTRGTAGGPPSPIERPMRRRESRLSQVDHAGRPQSWLDEVGNSYLHRHASAASPTSRGVPVTPGAQNEARPTHQYPDFDVPPSRHRAQPRVQGPFSGFNLALPSPEISKDLYLDSPHPPQHAELSEMRSIQISQSQPKFAPVAQPRYSLPTDSLDPYPEVFAGVHGPWSTTNLAASDGSYHSHFPGDTAFIGGGSPTDARRGSKAASASTVESNPNLHAFAAMSDVQYAVVEFKIWRSEIYTFRKSALELVRGSPVIVEADRGEDLGIIVGIFVNRRDAEEYKILKLRKNYQTLISYSKQPFPDAESLEFSFREYYKFNSTSPQATGDPKRGTQKAILRLANRSEIALLRNKEGLEERAKRTCAQKIREFKYPMEVVDAELQIDHKKLTYYTLSDEYVNFSPMVTELFKIFKFRIWISVLNPTAANAPQAAPKFFGGMHIPNNAPGNIGGKSTVSGAEMYPHQLYEKHSLAIPGSAPLGPIAAPRMSSGLVRPAGNYPPGFSVQDSDRYFSTSTTSPEPIPVTAASWNARYHPVAKENEQKLRSPGTPHSAISSGSTRGSSRKSIDYDELILGNFGSLNLNR